MILKTKKDHAWICYGRGCSFQAVSFDAAHRHAERTDHWLYEHLWGDRNRKPARSIHASDAGGCYLDAVPEPWYPPRLAPQSPIF